MVVGDQWSGDGPAGDAGERWPAGLGADFSGDAGGHQTADEILAEYLYQDYAEAYCCAAAGLRPPDARALVGPPDLWLRPPEQDR